MCNPTPRVATEIQQGGESQPTLFPALLTVLIVIAREFIISGIRLVASDNGVVIAAAMSGKLKTVVQMITVILLIINLPQLSIVTNIFIVLMLFLTVFSLCEYIIKNKSVIMSSK